MFFFFKIKLEQLTSDIQIGGASPANMTQDKISVDFDSKMEKPRQLQKQTECFVQSNDNKRRENGEKTVFFCFDVVSSQYKLNYKLSDCPCYC